tara:strand:+ start:434 stop:580 length:147 start_codon:yes stop_codon:yes gene_type:complete
MQKNYTLKEKKPVNVNQPKQKSIDFILNFSKSLEVIKMTKQNIELVLN